MTSSSLSSHHESTYEVLLISQTNYIVKIVGIIPGFDESVLDGVSSCLISTKVIEVESGKTECVLNVVHY